MTDVIDGREFRIPVTELMPGMKLSRNVTMRGATLIRHSTVLDEDLIGKLKNFNLDYLYVKLEENQIEVFKSIVVGNSYPPTYEKVREFLYRTYIHGIAREVHPNRVARTPKIAQRVQAAVESILQTIFASREFFELLDTTRFFTHPVLSHCPATMVYSLCIGALMEYPMPALIELGLSSLFYDIGMLKIDQKVIGKPGALNIYEFNEIKKHTFFGRNLLEFANRFSEGISLVAFEHHEKYYGGGYPRGISGNAMHEYSQIVAITDKYSAITTDRYYRSKLQPYQAFEHLINQTKTSVSPKIFLAFLKSVLIYPRNSILRLNTGAIGRAIDFPIQNPTRPVIEMLYNAKGEELIHSKNTKIDLSKHPDIIITHFVILEENEVDSLNKDVDVINKLNQVGRTDQDKTALDEISKFGVKF